MTSSNYLKTSQEEAKTSETSKNSGEAKDLIVGSGFLFSISPRAHPGEKCWYVAKGWGQPGANEVDLKSGRDLQVLTQKSVTPKYVKTELNKQESDDLNWRNGARVVIAGCTALSPLATTHLFTASLLAICGATGIFTEKHSGENVINSGKAEKIASADPQKQEAGALETEFSEKDVVDVFVKALKGKSGDGKQDCATLLKNAALQP